MQRNRYDYPKTPTLTSNSHTWLFGGSAGLDLGTSGHLAISPMLLYFRGWENQKTPIAPGGKNEKLVFSQIGAGLRFGFH